MWIAPAGVPRRGIFADLTPARLTIHVGYRPAGIGPVGRKFRERYHAVAN
jgi:hypothetical protein